MGRSVTDVAILLNVLQSPFGRVVGQPLPADYTQFLRRGSLQGARIGRDVRYFDYNYYGSGIPGDASTVGFAEHALEVMEELGATIVDCDTGDVFEYTDDEFTALLYEFKVQIAQYLATLTNTNMRTLADLIAFQPRYIAGRNWFTTVRRSLNWQNRRMGYPTNPTVCSRANTRPVFSAQGHRQRTRHPQSRCNRRTAPDELDGARRGGLSELVASRRDPSSSGKPAGMLMYSTFLREPKLIGFAYDLEQRMNVRRQPHFLGSVIPVPNADLCDNQQRSSLRCSLEQRTCRRTAASGKTEKILQLEHASRMTILLA